MKNMKTNIESVKVESNGFTARLEVSFKETHRLTGEEYSDSNAFACNFSGTTDRTAREAKLDCVEQARQWAKYRRLEGYDVSCFDDQGNCY